MADTKRIDKYSFSLSNVIGTGAFSKVYKGFNEQTKGIVAIKVIEMATIKNQTFVNLLQNEVAVMKDLNHENIVRLEDVYNTPNNIYLITEFCNGGDVGDILSKQKVLSESQVKAILSDVVKGLKELISKNIIHRDLKPQNFFIHNSVYKIGDFGFSKFLNSTEEVIVTTMVGTPLYMSPQCLSKVGYSSKCDIWSLGVCLFEMLTGNSPWPSNNHVELLKNMQSHQPHFPQNIPVSQMMKNLILRCLSVSEEFRISWKELFEHPLLGESKEFQTSFGGSRYLSSSMSKGSFTEASKSYNHVVSKVSGTSGYSAASGFSGFNSRLFHDKSNTTAKFRNKNNGVSTMIKNATTSTKKNSTNLSYAQSSNSLSQSQKTADPSIKGKDPMKVLNFMKVICQNIQDLSDKVQITPFVLERLLFVLSKKLAIFCKNGLINNDDLMGDSVKFLNDNKKFFFRVFSSLRNSKGKEINRDMDSDFKEIFNNELNDSDVLKRSLMKNLTKTIREINHACLLKFLKETEEKENLPHILIFLSALVDLFDIFKNSENTKDLEEIEISRYLTKRESTDVKYYKKIRRKIFELEI